MKNGKAYNVELPNGDAVTLCYVTGNDGPSLQVISSSWCEKAALDVQTDSENKRFKATKPAKTLCEDKDCMFCKVLRRLGVA